MSKYVWTKEADERKLEHALRFGSVTTSRSPWPRAARHRARRPRLDIGAYDVLEEVDALRRRLLRAREPVTAAELGVAGRRRRGRSGRDQPRFALRPFLFGVSPLMTPGFQWPSAPSRPCRSRGGPPSCRHPAGRGSEETLLERLGVDQLLERLAGLDAAGVVGSRKLTWARSIFSGH